MNDGGKVSRSTQPGERFDSLVLVELTHSPFFVVHFYDDLSSIHPSIHHLCEGHRGICEIIYPPYYSTLTFILPLLFREHLQNGE
jgi:hypothetical protein